MQTEDVFRSANERIAEKGRQLGWHSPVPFLCECSDSRCLARVDLSLEEYQHIRSHPQRYVTRPGHNVTDAFVLEQGQNASVAEKLYTSIDPG